jgi:hypothetical protein
MAASHAKGCICPRCKSERHRRFPNGCRECFVAPKVEGHLYCRACLAVRNNARKDAERRQVERRAMDRLTDAERRNLRGNVFTPEYELNPLRQHVTHKRFRTGSP